MALFWVRFAIGWSSVNDFEIVYDDELEINTLKNTLLNSKLITIIYYNFTYIKILLTKHMFELNVLFNVIESTKIRQIHPYLVGLSN